MNHSVNAQGEDFETCHKCGSFVFSKNGLQCSSCGEDRMLSQFEEIARTMMSLIAQDNGANNSAELKSEREKQPLKHVMKITSACRIFFSDESLISDDIIENICCGEQSEVNEIYGSINGFKELQEAINKYFDQL